MSGAELKTLGRYNIERTLGKGAMGVVYEGLDPKLNRRVAIKTILKSHLDPDTAKDYSMRFSREAQAVARLNHPHIVQVYDFAEEGDVAYLVMEFIRGKELKNFFDANERFDIKEAVRIMCELLDALDFAHNAGIIHRDIKPANVMLDSQARTKLTDFGVARVQDVDRTHAERTQAGTMVGTPAYMSPEQITGGNIDKRTDVFSAGIILYQFLTGEKPFTGGGAWTIAKKIIQEDPPLPSSLNNAVTPFFDAVVNKALSKNPDTRYQSSKDFAVALKRALEGRGEEEDSDKTIVGDISIAPAASRPAAPKPAAAVEGRGTTTGTQSSSQEVELEFWRAIKDGNDPDDFDLYVQQFPTGIYAALAKRKIAKLRGAAPEETGAEAKKQEKKEAEEAARREAEVKAKLEAEKEKLELELAKKEEEFKKREAEREAEATARIEAQEKAEKARLEAIEKAKQEAAAERERARQEAEKAKQEAAAERERAKQEAAAELAKREAEYKKREAEVEAKRQAEAKARAEAEAKARAEAEAKAKQEAALRAKQEAEAKAKREAEEKARAEAEAKARKEAELRAKAEAEAKAKREAEFAKRETELKKRVAEAESAPGARSKKAAAVIATIVGVVVLAIGGIGYYAFAPGDAEQKKQIEAMQRQLEESKKREAELKQAKEREEQARIALEKARQAEAEAKKSGDLAKQKELAEARVKAEAEAKKQAELTKKSEADAKKQADATKAAQDKASVADKAKAEKLAAEKAAAERAAAEKAQASRQAAEKADAEKRAAAERAALERAAAAEKTAAERIAAAEKAAADAAARAAAAEKAAEEKAKLAAVAPAAPAGGEALYQQAEALVQQGKGNDAVKLYVRAFRSGSGKAAKRLGDIYDKGLAGVSRDYAESLKWYNAARTMGEDVPLQKSR
jgi:serine/threonine protein kinase